MKNNANRFAGHFMYVIAIGYLVIIADNFERHLENLFQSTYDFTFLSLFLSISPIIFGFLLALPQLIRTCMQKGVWNVDWIVLVSVGLPSFFIAIVPIMCLAKSILYSNYGAYIFGFHPNLITLSGIVFGYVLVTSFHKQKSE